jgi:cytochrome c peroxidase
LDICAASNVGDWRVELAKIGPIKTFPLRGIKDSPPYMHDGRLLTLKDTVGSNGRPK